MTLRWIFGCCVIAGMACAQNVISLTKARTKEGGSKVVVNFGGPPRPGCLAAAVKGAPYYAEQVVEETRTLVDGTHVVETTPPSVVFRDSEGRRRFSTFFATGDGEDSIEFDVIRDYVAGREYLIDVANRTVHRMNFDPSAPRGDCPEGVPESRFAPAAVAPASVRNNLGRKTVETDLCDGTLLTTTILAGAEGNDKPIVITIETWTSRELSMRILSTKIDPREGTTVTRLTHILHREPVAELFAAGNYFLIVDETKPFSIEIKRPALSENERAVRAVIRKFADARNARDGKAAAATYADDGEYHGMASGNQTIRGRGPLASLWAGLSDLMMRHVDTVAFVNPSVAIARVNARQDSSYGVDRHEELFVVVHEGKEWKIRLHESPVGLLDR